MSIDGDGGCDLFTGVWHMCIYLFAFVREGTLVVCHSA
jgi:hypothetical protein